jgi:hypothetical protein
LEARRRLHDYRVRREIEDPAYALVYRSYGMRGILSCALSAFGLSAALADAARAQQAAPNDQTPVAPTPHAPYGAPPSGAPPQPTPEGAEGVAVTSKWTARLRGFVELDTIGDTTQSFTEVMGNNAIARPNTYPGDHGRMQLSARHSRLGFEFSSPESGGVRTSGLFEVDGLGNQPLTIPESAFYTNPTLRIRHAWLKIQTPFIDVLLGQSWQLFGWQPYFFPNTAEIQGAPAEVFGRAPQIRLSHVFKGAAVSVEVAVAASRPPQRDAVVPDGQAGVRLLVDDYRGLRTIGAAGTAVDAMGFGVSGAVRRFAVDNYSATPTTAVTDVGWAISVDALVPIISRTLKDKANALTFTGSYARGAGDADLYTALTGGLTFPPLPNPTGAIPAPIYVPDIDNGLVAFTPSGTLNVIQFQTFIFNLQYHLPPSGQVWLSATYSHLNSGNIAEFGAPQSVFTVANWVAASVFWDATEAVRLGAEYTWYGQTYADDVGAHNQRGHLIALYLF